MKKNGPVLMSPEHPDGWKLEELCHKLEEELVGKCTKIATDRRPQARRVLRNNQIIMALLLQIEALQRGSLDALEELGPDQGPLGTPRIGSKEAIEHYPKPTQQK